jgi:hypothetical protein
MPPTIVEFVGDRELLGLAISPAQRTQLKATYGLPLDAEEFAIFRACTGPQTYLAHAFSEVTVAAGARGKRFAHRRMRVVDEAGTATA